MDADTAIRAVFSVLSRHLTEGQALPDPVHDLWTDAERSRETERADA